MDKKIFKVLFYASALLSLLIMISNLIYPFASIDVGLFLPVARHFYEGKIFFHEIGVHYNPLSIITVGIPYLFDQNPDYRWHLVINFLIQIASSVVFYKILQHISKEKVYNLFFASLFLLLSLTLEGVYILLEPLSVFFQLAALCFYLDFIKSNNRSKLLLVGLFISLSFLSKQFGLFIALPIGVDMLIRESRIKNIGWVTLGFLLPLALFFIYLATYGVDFVQFMKFILGKGVEFDAGVGTAISGNFLNYPRTPLIITAYNLYILLIPVLIFKNYRKLDNTKHLFILLPLSSFLILFFGHYQHYYQYITPFLILLFVYLFQQITMKNHKTVVAFIFLASFMLIGYTSFRGLSRVKDDAIKQQKEANYLSSEIPPNSEVFIEGMAQAYYYLCNLNSINLKKIGYTFPDYFYPETLVENLKPGAYLVVPKEKFVLYENVIFDYTLKEISIKDTEYYLIEKN